MLFAREWSSYGCEVVKPENNNEDDDDDGDTEADRAAMCHCNHTSNFAILMQIVPFKVKKTVFTFFLFSQPSEVFL